MYYPPPYGYGAMAFTVGVVWGAAIWGGCNWGWGGSDVDIDINRQNNFNRNTSIDGGRNQASNRAGGKTVVAARCLASRRRQLSRQQDGAAVRSECRVEPCLARPGARLRSRWGVRWPAWPQCVDRRSRNPGSRGDVPRRRRFVSRRGSFNPRRGCRLPQQWGFDSRRGCCGPQQWHFVRAAATAPTAARATRASTDSASSRGGASRGGGMSRGGGGRRR